VIRYVFIVGLLHPLLLAGLPGALAFIRGLYSWPGRQSPRAAVGHRMAVGKRVVVKEMRTPVRLPDGFPISGGWIVSSWLSPSIGRRIGRW
jgi:hypothetical protein